VKKKNNNIRLIPRIDIKGSNLVKGINLEGFRALGPANLYIEKYYNEQADEILLNDVVASLYGRESLNDFIKMITAKVFVPLIVGGGIKTLNDIEYLLKSGADRIFFNSSIIKKPKLLDESVKYFGSSTIIASIEAIKISDKFMCLSDSGREETGLNVLAWAKEVESRGVSEIIITSISNEGIGKGFDLELINLLNETISIPFIVSGGYGRLNHIKEILEFSNLSGISIASALHYTAKNNLNFDTKNYEEGNYDFTNKKINYKNFETTSIKKIKKFINNNI
jgi:imidazole glycerol-phosphate synthase subunit HisF